MRPLFLVAAALSLPLLAATAISAAPRPVMPSATVATQSPAEPRATFQQANHARYHYCQWSRDYWGRPYYHCWWDKRLRQRRWY